VVIAIIGVLIALLLPAVRQKPTERLIRRAETRAKAVESSTVGVLGRVDSRPADCREWGKERA
jgi:hypothetical protein